MSEVTTDGFVLTGKPPAVTGLIRDTWRARELIAILARKDFYVRYRRATFGLLWAAALPVLQAVVLAFVVDKIARFNTGEDYVVYVLSGTVVWSTFSSIVNTGSTSVVDGAGLTTKIYFPRLVLPLTTAATTAYGFAISLTVATVAALVFVGGGGRTLLLIPTAILTLVLGAGFAMVLSALHVYFRDIRYLVQAALLVWFYVTPIIYPLELMGDWQPLIEANPMTGIVELSRAATVGADPGFGVSVAWTVGWCVVLVIGGLALHRKFDRVFVDLL
jgi:lipopolysaccharide transport system permease protein